LLTPYESEIDIREQSPLALAFVGDGVLELLVRRRLVGHTRLQPNQLHRHAVRFVSARGQFVGLTALLPLLTPEEQAVVRRGKNASKATVAKHATAEEYRSSTALEALFGWLYLQNRLARIEELFDVMWQAIEAQHADAAAQPTPEK
jgi:ribonuclease-3 family protein